MFLKSKEVTSNQFFCFYYYYLCMWHATFRENVKMHKNSNKENNCQKQSSTVEMSKIYKKITNELQNFWYFKAFKSVWIKSLKKQNIGCSFTWNSCLRNTNESQFNKELKLN